jgi:hypothetical protein
MPKAKQFLFICPYYTGALSASSTYLFALAEYIHKFESVKIHAPCISGAKLEILPIYPHQLSRILGVRISSMLLILYYLLCEQDVIIITDLNPCIGLFFNKRVYHVIHHLNDLPAIRNFLESLSIVKLLDPKLLVIDSWLSRCIWFIYFLVSTKNIITVSNTVKTDILSLAPRKHVQVVRNKNYLEPYSFLHKSSNYSIKTTKHFDLIMIGHKSSRKNYKLAFDSINQLACHFSSMLNVCIIGANTHGLQTIFPTSFELHTFSDLNRDQMVELILSSKVFLNTSILEGFCVPFVECQSLGLSCVVPNQPIFHENCFALNTFFCDLTVNSYVEGLLKALSIKSKISQITRTTISYDKYVDFTTANIDAAIHSIFLKD